MLPALHMKVQRPGRRTVKPGANAVQFSWYSRAKMLICTEPSSVISDRCDAKPLNKRMFLYPAQQHKVSVSPLLLWTIISQVSIVE